jgi:hypothetical protein
LYTTVLYISLSLFLPNPSHRHAYSPLASKSCVTPCHSHEPRKKDSPEGILYKCLSFCAFTLAHLAHLPISKSIVKSTSSAVILVPPQEKKETSSTNNLPETNLRINNFKPSQSQTRPTNSSPEAYAQAPISATRSVRLLLPSLLILLPLMNRAGLLEVPPRGMGPTFRNRRGRCLFGSCLVGLYRFGWD